MLFEKTSLGDYAEVQGGYAYKSKDLQPEGFCPVIKIKNVRDGFLSLGDISYVREDLASQTTRFLCETGDVLISMTGSGPNAPDSMVGRVARVKGSDLPALINQRVGRLLIREAGSISQNFLYYCLSSRSARNYLVSSSTGSANQANISADTIKSLQIPKISYKESVEIGEFLSKFDDKIELNQRMNQTLEEIAKAIFKSWFVDFDPVRAKAEGRPTGLPPEISDLFPDELVDSEIGEIPKGWEIKRVEEICEKIAMGPFGSNIKVSTFVDDGIPIISGHHLHNFLLREGDHKFITEEHAERLKNSLVRSGDVIFTHAGTVGQVSLIPTDSDYETYVISQRQFYARPLRPEHSAYLNFFFHSPVGQHKLLSNVSGSGVPSIARPSSHLKAIELTLADEHLVRKFDQLVGPMIERMVLVSREIETLAELRDTLLPKLISGELRIPDAEKFLKEAGI